MATILYTTTDKIRACIGCDEEDLPDAVVNGQELELLMLERLSDVYPTHETEATEAGERRLALWSMYFGALTLIEDSTLSLAQKIQSNTDQLSRFDIDFERLKEELRKKLAMVESKLAPEVYGTPFSIMGKATPAYDPVTGE